MTKNTCPSGNRVEDRAVVAPLRFTIDKDDNTFTLLLHLHELMGI